MVKNYISYKKIIICIYIIHKNRIKIKTHKPPNLQPKKILFNLKYIFFKKIINLFYIIKFYLV